MSTFVAVLSMYVDDAEDPRDAVQEFADRVAMEGFRSLVVEVENTDTQEVSYVLGDTILNRDELARRYDELKDDSPESVGLGA